MNASREIPSTTLDKHEGAKDKNQTMRTVHLPSDLCAALEKELKGTKFGSLEELLTFILQELTAGNGAQHEAQERKLIEQRLRELGYL